jgi:hypothetical protein
MSEQFPLAGLFGNRYVEMTRKAFVAGRIEPIVDIAVSYTEVGDIFELWARDRLPFCTSAVMLRRQLALQCGGFPIGSSHGEDLVLFMQMALLAPIVVSNYPGCFYLRGTESLAAQAVRQPDAAMQLIQRLIRDGQFSRGSSLQAASEVYRKLALAHALDSLLDQRIEDARLFVSLSAGTRSRRIKWLAAYVLLLLPEMMRRRITEAHRRRRN